MRKLIILFFLAGLLLLAGCGKKDATQDNVQEQAEETHDTTTNQVVVDDKQDVDQDSIEINTGEIESDIELSELDDIGSELDEITW